MNQQGGIGINTMVVPANFKLAVNGNIISESLTIRSNGTWPDYVFDKSYKLPSLHSVEKEISVHGHLPGVPSALEVINNGINVGDINIILLKKIEESTLYLIEQNKKIESLMFKVKALELEIIKIKNGSL